MGENDTSGGSETIGLSQVSPGGERCVTLNDSAVGPKAAVSVEGGLVLMDGEKQDSSMTLMEGEAGLVGCMDPPAAPAAETGSGSANAATSLGCQPDPNLQLIIDADSSRVVESSQVGRLPETTITSEYMSEATDTQQALTSPTQAHQVIVPAASTAPPQLQEPRNPNTRQRSRRRRLNPPPNPLIRPTATTTTAISRQTFTAFLHIFHILWYIPTLIINPITLLLFSTEIGCDAQIRMFLLVATFSSLVDCPRIPLKMASNLFFQRERAPRIQFGGARPREGVLQISRPLSPAAEPDLIQLGRASTAFLSTSHDGGRQDVRGPTEHSDEASRPLATVPAQSDHEAELNAVFAGQMAEHILASANGQAATVHAPAPPAQPRRPAITYRTASKSLIRFLTPLWALIWLFNPVWTIVGAVWLSRASNALAEPVSPSFSAIPCWMASPIVFYLTFFEVVTQLCLLISWSIVGWLHIRGVASRTDGIENFGRTDRSRFLIDDQVLLAGDDFWAPVDPESMRPAGAGISDEEWDAIVAEKFQKGHWENEDEEDIELSVIDVEESKEVYPNEEHHRKMPTEMPKTKSFLSLSSVFGSRPRHSEEVILQPDSSFLVSSSNALDTAMTVLPSSSSSSLPALPGTPSSPMEEPRRCDMFPDDSPTCSICLCDYEEGDALRRLVCGHRFHEACAWRWLRDARRGGVGKRTCPLCVMSVVREG
ncbi:hypothetical protein HDU67_001540 [Dinochytrium kinnereticum]|nr:hypothetical protein HDU67_001540 [Dinochytrium kinnereticum]